MAEFLRQCNQLTKVHFYTGTRFSMSDMKTISRHQRSLALLLQGIAQNNNSSRRLDDLTVENVDPSGREQILQDCQENIQSALTRFEGIKRIRIQRVSAELLHCITQALIGHDHLETVCCLSISSTSEDDQRKMSSFLNSLPNLKFMDCDQTGIPLGVNDAWLTCNHALTKLTRLDFFGSIRPTQAFLHEW